MQVILLTQFATLNKWLFVLLLGCLPLMPCAQMKLLVLGKCPDCYVQYKLNAGETPASVSEWAGVPIEQLLRLNQLSSVESPAPSLKIPLNAQNVLSQKSALPVFHVVEKGDNLYRLNIQYFNPGINKIKEWNQLKNETLKDGEVILVGYLGARSNVSSSVQVPVPPVPQSNTTSAPAKVVSSTNLSTITSTTIPASTLKESPKNIPVPASPEVTAAEGYFAAQFKPVQESGQLIAISGSAGIFKSITGFTDQRFYVLLNDVIPGTIVRITVDQVKYICAKVLGPVPDNKPNKGLLIRISNAAAAALGISDAIFPVIVQYFE
ncbi:MAG: LysM peptidoglycan-binding domain-containing protein [Sediminibacterium sp.]|nr:LysM peptidoglycan-binding domain-containing protein [Sediminibacterium sp.]